MFDKFGCKFEDVLYVLLSLCYDLMMVEDLGIRYKVFVNCGYELGMLFYNYYEVLDIGQFVMQFGL